MFRCHFSLLLTMFLSVCVVRHCNCSCMDFKTRCLMMNVERELTTTLTLRFSLSNICDGGTNPTRFISITQNGADPPNATICFILLSESGSCVSTIDCSCGPGLLPYVITRQIRGTAREMWTLTGTLKNERTFSESVEINEKFCASTNSQSEGGSTVTTTSVDASFVDTSPEQSTTTSTKLTSETLLVSTEQKQSVTTSAKLNENTLTELKQLMVVIAIGVPVSIFVMVLVILLVFKRSLGRRVNEIRKRRSGNFTHDVAMKAMKPVGQVVPQFRALYGGSNVSLMVSNELYGEVPDNKQDKCVPLPASTRAMMPLPPVQGDAASCVKASGATALPACELEGDYAEVNSLCGDKPEESGACGGEDTYMDVSKIRRLKAEQGVLKDEAATTRL